MIPIDIYMAGLVHDPTGGVWVVDPRTALPPVRLERIGTVAGHAVDHVLGLQEVTHRIHRAVVLGLAAAAREHERGRGSRDAEPTDPMSSRLNHHGNDPIDARPKR